MLVKWLLLLPILGIPENAALEAAVFKNEGGLRIRRASVVFPVKMGSQPQLRETLLRAIINIFKQVKRRTKLIEDAHLSEMAEENMKAIQISLNRLDPFILAKVQATTSEEENSKTIKKRALIDAGGMLLKAVFGTATSQDTEALKQQIINTTELVLQTDTRITLEAEEMKTAIKQIIVTAEKQNLIQENLLDKITETQTIVMTLAQIKSMINYLNAIITDYRITLNTIHSHYVPLIFTHPQIIKLFNQAQKLFPKYEIPIDPANSTIEELHKYLEMKQTDTEYMYALIVPLVEKQPYELIEMAAMPIKNAEGSLFMTTNLEKFMGISETNFFTTNDKLRDCKEIKKTKVCKAPLKMMDIKTENSCTKNIYYNSTKSCTFQPVKIDNIYTIRLQDHWFVFISKPITAVLQCNEEKVVKDFIGIVEVKPHCTFETKHLTLTSIKHSNSEKIINPFLLEPQAYPANFTYFNDSQLNEASKKFIQINEALEQAFNMTNSSLSNLHVNHQNMMMHTKIIYAGLTFSTLLFISSIIAGIGYFYLKKKQYKKVNPDEDSEFMHWLRQQKYLQQQGTM